MSWFRFFFFCFELHGWLPFQLTGSSQGLRASNLKTNFFPLSASQAWPIAALGRNCVQEEVKNAAGWGFYYSSQRQKEASFSPPKVARIILPIFQVEEVRPEGTWHAPCFPPLFLNSTAQLSTLCQNHRIHQHLAAGQRWQWVAVSSLQGKSMYNGSEVAQQRL